MGREVAHRYHFREMASFEFDEPAACPFLGLATDPRSHFTYPHPGHRCFAANRPATADARRQSAFCLNTTFPTCDRYVARRRKAGQGGSGRSPRPAEAATAAPGSPPGAADADPTAVAADRTVVHVFRMGDSLTRIAATYGVTVDDIATVNRLAPNKPVPDGSRLVIPVLLAPLPPAPRRKSRLGR
jgi:hypothetical protein